MKICYDEKSLIEGSNPWVIKSKIKLCIGCILLFFNQN